MQEVGYRTPLHNLIIKKQEQKHVGVIDGDSTDIDW